jgi:hypothetical protein
MTLRDPSDSDDDEVARAIFGENAASFLDTADAELADDAQRVGEAVGLMARHLISKGVSPAAIGGAVGGAAGAALSAVVSGE